MLTKQIHTNINLFYFSDDIAYISYYKIDAMLTRIIPTQLFYILLFYSPTL